MDDKQSYLRWLEEMWNVQKFDIHGSTEREEERTEEVLEVFRGLVRLSRRRVEPPGLLVASHASERNTAAGSEGLDALKGNCPVSDLRG
jgi:hypothetical protein